MDPKLGPQRKTAGVRNLPKIDRQVAGKGSKQKQQGKAAKAFGGKVDFEANGTVLSKNTFNGYSFQHYYDIR